MSGKRCVIVEATKKVKKHVRCYAAKSNDTTKSQKTNSFRDHTSGNYEKTRVVKGFSLGNISDDDAKHYMKLSGVPADLEGGVSIGKSRFGLITVEVDNHPDIYLKRIIDFDNKTIINDEFRLKGDPKSYVGTEVFSRQVVEARNSGFKKIETYAARNDANGYNGYYTWMRAGYKPLKGAEADYKYKIDSFNKANGTSHKSMTDLMKDQKGRDFWKEKGDSFRAEFDLSPDSYSSKTLNEYVKTKKRT